MPDFTFVALCFSSFRIVDKYVGTLTRSKAQAPTSTPTLSLMSSPELHQTWISSCWPSTPCSGWHPLPFITLVPSPLYLRHSLHTSLTRIALVTECKSRPFRLTINILIRRTTLLLKFNTTETRPTPTGLTLLGGNTLLSNTLTGWTMLNSYLRCRNRHQSLKSLHLLLRMTWSQRVGRSRRQRPNGTFFPSKSVYL